MVIWKVLLFVKCSDGQALQSTAWQSVISINAKFMLILRQRSVLLDDAGRFLAEIRSEII